MSLAQKNIGIWGFGISGQETARYWMQQFSQLQNQPHPKIWIYDQKPKTDFDLAIQDEFKELNWLNQKPNDLVWQETKSIFLSPGIAASDLKIPAKFLDKIQITSEFFFAYQKLKAPIIAVTGTNGKSTTVSLIAYLLEKAGFCVGLKGNIGSPLITALFEKEKDVYVVELSSFQLENAKGFRPKISILLNISDDHQDRYVEFSDYTNAKAEITRYQTQSDFFIYNHDDAIVQKIAIQSKATKIPFSLTGGLKNGASATKTSLVFDWQKFSFAINQNQLPLYGLHQWDNMMASILAVLAFGVSSKSIQKHLPHFKGLKHRLELVLKKNSIEFFNDSKATNVQAVAMSIASFEKPLVLIMGGYDKGGDFSVLKDLIKNKASHLICYGKAAQTIKEQINFDQTECIENFADAVMRAIHLVQPNQVVLLAPGCASFDQHQNFAHRGQEFVRLVLESESN